MEAEDNGLGGKRQQGQPHRVVVGSPASQQETGGVEQPGKTVPLRVFGVTYQAETVIQSDQQAEGSGDTAEQRQVVDDQRAGRYGIFRNAPAFAAQQQRSRQQQRQQQDGPKQIRRRAGNF